MPPKKSVYTDRSKITKSTKTSKATAVKPLSKGDIAIQLAQLKNIYGKNYIDKKLSKLKLASDAQMTRFINGMKRKKAPRDEDTIKMDIESEKERLGAGIVNDMLRGAGVLEPMEMEDLLVTLRGMKAPKKVGVSKEERITVDSAHDNLVKVAENSSSEDLRSVAKEVDDQLSVAQIKRNKLDKINGELREGIDTFRNMITLTGEFDPSKNVNIKLDIPTISGVLARLNASFTELSGEQVKFAEIPFDSILGALTSSFESTKKVVEVVNTYSNDLTHAVNSKSISEMGRAVAAAAFTTIEDFIYGDMPRNVSESQKDYDSRVNELKKILLQKQDQFNSNTGLLTVANERIRTLTHELSDAREKIETGAGSYNKLAGDYKKIEEGVGVLNNELSYLRAARDSFINLTNHFKVEFDKLAPRIEQALGELETDRNSLKTKLAEEEGKHKEEITILKAEIEQKEKDVSYWKDMTETANDHFNTIINENLAQYVASSELKDKVMEQKDKRIEHLRNKINSIKKNKTDAENDLKKTRTQLEGLETQLQLQQNEIDTLNSRIESLKKSLSDASTADSKAKALKESYEAENAELKKKLEAETNNVIIANRLIDSQKMAFLQREKDANEAHQQALDKLQADIEVLKTQYKVAQKLVNSRNQKIETLTAEKAELLQQLEETQRRSGDLAIPSMSAEKVRQTLDAAADTIAAQQQSIDGMKFLWDGLIHPKAEFHGKAQIIGSQGELERITNLSRRFRIAYEKKSAENVQLQKRLTEKINDYNSLLEELTALRERSTQQHQGLNPEAKAHIQLVAEAANPNGQIAKLMEAEQSIAAASLLTIPGDIPSAPPAKVPRLVVPPPDDGGDSWWDLFGGFFRGMFGGNNVANAPLPGGDPDYDMGEEGFLGPENRAFERLRIRAWRTLGYKSEVSTARKSKRDGRRFTSSRFVGGFIVGHAPDWNLQPNELIFDFWNNYYNSSKPFDL